MVLLLITLSDHIPYNDEVEESHERVVSEKPSDIISHYECTLVEFVQSPVLFYLLDSHSLSNFCLSLNLLQ